MKTITAILFYPKKSKVNAKGQCVIYTRITVNGRRIEFSTGRYISPEKWSSEKGKMKGQSAEARSINKHLDILKTKIIDIQMEFIHTKTPISAKIFKSKVLGEDGKRRMLIPIFEDHNKRIEELVGKEYAPGTLQRYKTSLKHTKEFLEWKYKESDIDILKINHAFITDYEFYLRSVRNCSNNTAVKYIKNFGKIIKICLANNWMDRNPFSNYKSKIRTVERVYLNEPEIQRLLNKDFKSERLSLVRDIFLFSCYTGLAYTEMSTLTTKNIEIGFDGKEWIKMIRKKTNKKISIPILPKAREILDKYDGKLPTLSNQKFNSYLKEISELVGINKKLTHHTARKTFATTVLLFNNVPMEIVSELLGHSNMNVTQSHYGKIVQSKVSTEIHKLTKRME